MRAFPSYHGGGEAGREALIMMRKSSASALTGRASMKVGLWEGAGHLSGRTS